MLAAPQLPAATTNCSRPDPPSPHPRTAETLPLHSPKATDSADACSEIPAAAALPAETSTDSAPPTAASSAPSQTAAQQSAACCRVKTHTSNPSPAVHSPDRRRALRLYSPVLCPTIPKRAPPLPAPVSHPPPPPPRPMPILSERL